MPRHAIYDRCGVYYSLHFLISRARERPIASTGRQENCHLACRASTECAAAQMRNAVFQPDTRSEAAGASRASSQAEVCGPACLTASRKQVLQHRQSAALPGRQGKVFSSVSGSEMLLTRGFEFTTLFHQNSIITGKKKPPCGINPARWYVLLQIGIYFFKSHTHYFFLSAAA